MLDEKKSKGDKVIDKGETGTYSGTAVDGGTQTFSSGTCCVDRAGQ